MAYKALQYPSSSANQVTFRSMCIWLYPGGSGNGNSFGKFYHSPSFDVSAQQRPSLNKLNRRCTYKYEGVSSKRNPQSFYSHPFHWPLHRIANMKLTVALLALFAATASSATVPRASSECHSIGSHYKGYLSTFPGGMVNATCTDVLNDGP